MAEKLLPIPMRSSDVDFLVGALQRNRLKFVGNRILMLCPFHEEKSAGFHINSTKKTFACYRCKKKGSIDELKALLDKEQNKIPATIYGLDAKGITFNEPEAVPVETFKSLEPKLSPRGKASPKMKAKP